MSTEAGAEAASLLETAREALRNAIASRLEGEQRYLAAMIANAMAIAARQLRNGDDTPATEAAALRLILGQRTGEDLRTLHLAAPAPGPDTELALGEVLRRAQPRLERQVQVGDMRKPQRLPR